MSEHILPAHYYLQKYFSFLQTRTNKQMIYNIPRIYAKIPLYRNTTGLFPEIFPSTKDIPSKSGIQTTHTHLTQSGISKLPRVLISLKPFPSSRTLPHTNHRHTLVRPLQQTILMQTHACYHHHNSPPKCALSSRILRRAEGVYIYVHIYSLGTRKPIVSDRNRVTRQSIIHTTAAHSDLCVVLYRNGCCASLRFATRFRWGLLSQSYVLTKCRSGGWVFVRFAGIKCCCGLLWTINYALFKPLIEFDTRPLLTLEQFLNNLLEGETNSATTFYLSYFLNVSYWGSKFL